jgi:hypothetical protein
LCLESPIADSWGKTRCGSRGGVLSGCEPCPFCGGANDVLTARSAALVSCCTGRTANLFTVLCIRVVQGSKREVEAWKSWASCRSIRIILRRDTCLLFAAMCCHASSLLNELHPNLPRLFYEEPRKRPRHMLHLYYPTLRQAQVQSIDSAASLSSKSSYSSLEPPAFFSVRLADCRA